MQTVFPRMQKRLSDLAPFIQAIVPPGETIAGTVLIRGAWIAAIAYAAIALLIGAGDIAFILRHYTTYPFGDHWIWLGHFSKHGLRDALLSQYNEHRLFVPGLLYWTDIRFFGEKNAFLIAASIAINLGCIILLALPLIRLREVPLPVRMVFFGFVAVVMLWFIQGPNFFYPFSLCLALANLGILSALSLFIGFFNRESAMRSGSGWLLAGSLACGFAGTFSYGHGILIWPLLLCLALILRIRIRYLASIAAAAAVALFLYFRHYVTPAAHSNPIESLRQPVKLASYFVTMIGLPWLNGDNALLGFRYNIMQYVIILSGLLLSFAFIGIFAARRASGDHTIFYSSILMLAIGSAGITALGRSNFPAGQSLSGRYAPIPLLFWVSLLALMTVYLCRFEASGGAGRALWCAALAAVSLATVPTQFSTGSYLAGNASSQQAAVASIALGIPDPASINHNLYPSWAFLKLVDQATMQSLHHSSVFELPESALLGSALQPRFHIAETCESSVDAVRAYQAENKDAVRLSGWLFDRREETSASKVLVTDAQGIITGFGVGEVSRPDVAAVFHDRAMLATGWIAYSRMPADGSRQLRVFGELPGRSDVCEVISPKTTIPL